VDLKDHVVKKLTPTSGIAGKISLVALLAAAVFALGTFIGTVAHPGAESFERGLEIVTLDPYGMNGTTLLNNSLPFPQLVFCPLWEEGTIDDMACWKAQGSGFVSHGNPLSVVKFNNSRTPKFPSNICWGYNTDGKALTAWDDVITCNINSSNTNSMKQTWAGRVRVYVDPPGSVDFEGCQYCIDGVDGTLAIQGYKTLAFWQANYFAARFNNSLHERVDYRTDSTRVPFAQEAEVSKMVFIGGFYTPSVWLYERPDVLRTGKAIHGEEFAYRVAFIAALLLVSYFLWSCLKSTFVLLFVGEQGTQ